MSLKTLRHIGPAALQDLATLGIHSCDQLATCDADALYRRLCIETGKRHDPCVHDVFSAAIYQARTGEVLDWWHFTPLRKSRQENGSFVAVSIKTGK